MVQRGTEFVQGSKRSMFRRLVVRSLIAIAVCVVSGSCKNSSQDEPAEESNHGVDTIEVADTTQSVLHKPDSIGPCSEHVKPKHIVRPELSEEFRRTIQEPIVIVRLLVDTDGTVMQAEIVRSVQPLLDELALEAVRKWEFTPPNGGDKPKRCYITFPVRFRLKEK